MIANLDAKAAMTAEPLLDMGITGTYGTDANNHLLAEADFALFIGCDVGDQITCNWKLPAAGTRTAHISAWKRKTSGHNLPGRADDSWRTRRSRSKNCAAQAVARRRARTGSHAPDNAQRRMACAQHRQHIESDAVADPAGTTHDRTGPVAAKGCGAGRRYGVCVAMVGAVHAS